MTLFYKSTSVVGGGGKLYYKDKEVKKLYFSDKLVYENILPIGTVISKEPVTIAKSVGNGYVSLIKVNDDLSNVTSDIELDFSYGYNHKVVTFSKEDLLARVGVHIDNSSSIYFQLTKNKTLIITKATNWEKVLQFNSATLV